MPYKQIKEREIKFYYYSNFAHKLNFYQRIILWNYFKYDMYGGQERCILDLVGRPEGKRPLGRLGRRWQGNIKMNIQNMGWGVRLDCSGS